MLRSLFATLVQKRSHAPFPVLPQAVTTFGWQMGLAHFEPVKTVLPPFPELSQSFQPVDVLRANVHKTFLVTRPKCLPFLLANVKAKKISVHVAAPSGCLKIALMKVTFMTKSSMNNEQKYKSCLGGLYCKVPLIIYVHILIGNYVIKQLRFFVHFTRR